MTAKRATVDECILAGIEDGCGTSEGSIIARNSSNKQQTDGMQFGCGYLSPFFITDLERMEVVFENAYIFIHEGKISSRKDLLPLLEQMTKIGKPLLIIADDVGGEALATLVVNKLRGPLQIAAVRAPGLGDERKRMLQELALVIGSKSIGEGIDIQLRNMQISDLVKYLKPERVVFSELSACAEGFLYCAAEPRGTISRSPDRGRAADRPAARARARHSRPNSHRGPKTSFRPKPRLSRGCASPSARCPTSPGETRPTSGRKRVFAGCSSFPSSASPTLSERSSPPPSTLATSAGRTRPG